MIFQSQQCTEEATMEEENILQNDENEQGGDGQEEDNMEEPGIVMIMIRGAEPSSKIPPLVLTSDF